MNNFINWKDCINKFLGLLILKTITGLSPIKFFRNILFNPNFPLGKFALRADPPQNSYRVAGKQ